MAKQTPNPDLNVDLMFPSKYLRAADFQGKDAPLVVAGAKKESLKMKDGSEKEGYVLTFQGTEKMFVLNKTNAQMIASVLGEKKARLWAGKRIVLYPTTCMAFGKKVDCIRVRETAAPAPSRANLAPPPGPMPDELPGDDQGS